MLQPRSNLNLPHARKTWAVTPPGKRQRPYGPVVIAAFLFMAFLFPCLGAKEKKPSRVVSGVVSDEAENPIAGAAVVLTDLQTGKKSATYTSEAGAYQFTDLQPTRDYAVQANNKGLSSRVRKISTIDPRERIVVNLRIPPPKEDEE